jgi:Tfp pilus assembly protein PilO
MSSNRIIVAMVAVAALAAAFWVLLLSPKKSEVSKLDQQVAKQEESLALHQQEVQQGLEAQRAFPREYQQLVVLGKAAPAEDDTASLLVQLNRIARSSRVHFGTFTLAAAGTSEEAAVEPVEAAAPEGESVSPTEVAASKLPLGASLGPAGLAVMPYALTFNGSFFHIADFIHGLDSLVKTNNAQVDVTGRLITISGFSLAPDPDKGFPDLHAEFTITTFLVPPSQGVTGGATPTSPEPGTSTQVAATTGGTP